MKKIIAFLALSCCIFSLAFSKNLFTKRIFEIQVGVPLDFSNNTLSFDDIFVKELCIDLEKIANDVPDEGFNLLAMANPYFGFNLNIGPVIVGSSLGLDAYEKMSISKDFFDFLGKGNEIGQEQNFDVKNITDVFFVADAKVGIEFKKFSLIVKPSLFVPVISSSKTNVSASFVNDENGNVNFSATTNLNLFTNISINSENGDFDVQELFSGMGFDLSGELTFPIKKLLFTASARIPVVPGSYKYNMNITTNNGYQVSLSDFTSTDNSTGTTRETYSLEKKQYINRPLKINAYVDYKMLAGLLEFRGGAGFGVYHPFLEDAFCYPEYYLSAGINFIDIIKAKISTEYTKQLFKHQLAVDLNLRIFEIECGASLQSTNILKSFSKTGFGAYAIVSIGF